VGATANTQDERGGWRRNKRLMTDMAKEKPACNNFKIMHNIMIDDLFSALRGLWKTGTRVYT
jgi:hypothetical protein